MQNNLKCSPDWCGALPRPARSLALAALATLGLVSGCAGPEQGSTPAADAKAAGDAPVFDAKKSDTGSPGDVAGQGGDTATGDVAGAGKVTLTFEVDDSANKTFGDGEMVWTGSFAWDEKTNTIVYATSWLPTDGPYPPLYDDGPISGGGHEREGGTKGDHIFSTQVQFATVADTTIEYGALNELGNWMWIGKNGLLPLKKGQSGVVAVPGMKLGQHGAIDMKVTLDTAALNACCTKWNTKEYAFYLKGTMNMWTPIQLLDDGAKGDDKAGDGILSYVHKLNLGKHDGGLSAGEEVQFIFVSTKGDQTPDAGAEYKAGPKALSDGVKAWTNTGVGGAWEEVPVVLSKDSKGKVDNTGIVVPTPKGGSGGCTPACQPAETCDAGVCKPKAPVDCTPACSAIETCTQGKCVAIPVTVTAIDPSKGDVGGGTSVTVSGAGFAAKAQVLLDSVAATDVVVAADGKSLTCKTPAHAKGMVAVTVQNPGGAKATLADAFSYQEPPKPVAAVLLPADGTVVVSASPWSLTASVAIGAITAGPGVTPDLSVWLGTGPVGADPALDPAKFTWTQAQYDGEGSAGDELWTAAMPAATKGPLQAAAKVGWSGKFYYSPGLALSVLDAADMPTVFKGIEPQFASSIGGSSIILKGVNLPANSTVELASKSGTKVQATGVTVVAAGLQVTVPALPLGLADVTLAPPGKPSQTLAGVLHVAPIAVVTLGGDPAKSFPAPLKIATNSVPTAWGAGKNELTTLWLAYDADNLYIGIAGTCEAANAITAYLDVDYGAGTGVKGPTALSDSAGAVDDAISNALTVADAGVGLDFALASIGMASFSGADLSKSTAAGWRGLSTPTDLAWLAGDVKATGGVGIEATISLKTLFPKGIPGEGSTLKLAVALGNAPGGQFSNAFLPEQSGAASATQLSSWASIEVFPVKP